MLATYIRRGGDDVAHGFAATALLVPRGPCDRSPRSSGPVRCREIEDLIRPMSRPKVKVGSRN